MTWRRIEPNDAKFRELILYVTQRSEGDAPFGMTKLNKILFFMDFTAYAFWGQPITGQEYQALEWGPAPRRLLPILAEMGDSIAVGKHEYYTRDQKRPHALRDPDLSRFTPDEIALVDALIQEWWGVSATEISNASHGFIGWQVTRKGETIPYETALVDAREPTKGEIERGMELEPEARRLLAANA